MTTDQDQSPDKGLLMIGGVAGVIVLLVLVATFFGVV